MDRDRRGLHARRPGGRATARRVHDARGRVPPASIVLDELDRVLEVAGPALDADPYVSESTAEAVSSLESWWIARDADVRAQLGL